MAIPIPGPEGTLSRPEYDTLLTCTLGEDVTVRRVSDQDSEFLRFVERHDLKPGQVVRVEDRDPAADSVRLRGQDREFTIGARAASKVLVEVVRAVLLMVLALERRVRADDQRRRRPGSPPSPSPSRTTRFWSRRPSIRRRASFRTSRSRCS